MPHRVLPKGIISLFFIIGLFSATLFRLIIFLNRINILWARIAWYLGVVGYILFFGYRYFIARKRRKAIEDNDLLKKLKASDMEPEASGEIEYILTSLLNSREIVNYVYIFVTSIFAIIADLILVMFRM